MCNECMSLILSVINNNEIYFLFRLFSVIFRIHVTIETESDNGYLRGVVACVRNWGRTVSYTNDDNNNNKNDTHTQNKSQRRERRERMIERMNEQVCPMNKRIIWLKREIFPSKHYKSGQS